MTDTPAARDAPAEIGRRIFAYLIDAAIAAAIALVLSGVFFGIVVLNGSTSDRRTLTAAVLLASAAVAIGTIVWCLVYTAMQGAGGSIGQRSTGIRLVDATSGMSLGFWRALLRNLVWAVSTAILVGYVTPLFDGSGMRRGWHDLASGAVVVDRTRPVTRAGIPPAAPASGRDPVEPGLREGNAPIGGRTPAPEVISFVPGITADPVEVRAAASGPARGPAAAPARSTAAASGPARETAVATPPAMRSVGAAPTEVDETRAAPAPRASLTWDDGTRVGVYGRTLFGRNPAGEPGATVVAVRDETLSLSKTHFEVDGDARGVWIVDRHSTNGTILVRDSQRVPLEPGERMPLRTGDRLEFGDRSATVGGTA